jgi:hypothetical protein
VRLRLLDKAGGSTIAILRDCDRLTHPGVLSDIPTIGSASAYLSSTIKL